MHIDYADATPVAAGVGKYFWLTDARLRESYVHTQKETLVSGKEENIR